MRPLLQLPQIAVGAHPVETGPYPFGNVPLTLDYANWVESKWPGDILDLMGGQEYDGRNGKALTLYRCMIAKRAYDIRYSKKPVEQVAYNPETFSDIEDGSVVATVAGTDASGQPLKTLPTLKEPTFWDGLKTVGVKDVTDFYGLDPVDSWLSLPGELIAKVLKPLVWIGVVIGLIILVVKLPDFSGVKIKANIGGGSKKGKA